MYSKISINFTHLLKCVFFFKASNILGCSFPICSSIFDNFVPLFFLLPFSVCCFNSLLCRRLLRNILTDLSKTEPDVNGLKLGSMVVVVVVVVATWKTFKTCSCISSFVLLFLNLFSFSFSFICCCWRKHKEERKLCVKNGLVLLLLNNNEELNFSCCEND